MTAAELPRHDGAGVETLLLQLLRAQHGSVGLGIPAQGFASELAPTFLLLRSREPIHALQRLEWHLDVLCELL
jgi:hypothetical protein